MPWTTPTLEQLRTTNANNIVSKLQSQPLIPNSSLRITADANAGLAYSTLLYLDWQAKQLMVDTAETEWLDRFGTIWLGGRKQATFASGSVNVTGINGAIVPIGSQLSGSTSEGIFVYQTTAQITIGNAATEMPIVAITPGAAGNLDQGSYLAFVIAIAGIDGAAIVNSLTGGTDQETDDELRARILLRIRQPPMGGSASDYEQWALAVPGVTRVWVSPNEQGAGTMVIRFLMDDLRASDNGWPTPDDITAVIDYIDQVRPVTVKDCYVFAPIKQFINITIANLVPNTTEVIAEIETSIRQMLMDQAAPGQTIFAAWISYAIMTTSVQSFFLATDTDYVMTSPGNMAVLGTINYE